MKQLLSILLVSLVFIGCVNKQRVVEIKNPSAELKDNLGKEIGQDNKLGNEIVKEEIDGLENIDIIENEIPLIDSDVAMNLAVTYPSRVVGKYAKSSMNTILGYLSYKKIKYEVKVFDSISENIETIQDSFNKIKEAGFTNVIALYSPKSTDLIHLVDTSGLKVYLPLVNKNDVAVPNENFIYGAISYDKQIETLYEYSNLKNTMFYQESYIGNKLKEKYELIVPDVKVVKAIKKKRNYFKGIVKDYRIKNSSLFLNTNIVKTSIILSQLRAYDIKPRVILSTQINFNPKLLTLTQVKDRLSFVVANSIDDVDTNLADEIATFGGDIKYNWVDYSTLVGVNYLYDSNYSQVIKTQIEDNQVMYQPKLFKTTAYGFLEIK